MLELGPLWGEKNFTPRLQNRLMVPRGGCFQNFQRAPSLCGNPPGVDALDPHLPGPVSVLYTLFR